MKTACMTFVRNFGPGLLALLAVLPLLNAGPPPRAGPSAAPAFRAAPAPRPAPSYVPVQPNATGATRFNHGTIRHADSQVIQRPATVYQRPATVYPRPAPVLQQPAPALNRVEPRRFESHQHGIVHRDVDVDVNRPRHWHSFAFGARQHHLREGFISLFVSGVPFFYDDGIYYQQDGDDYQEVYPPVGAEIVQPPDGAIEIDADSSVYYYAGGAFYVQQDGGFVIIPAPIGVLVPELPPGAAPVTVNNGVAYQFNGTYYQPLFVNGVTQYLTIAP